MTITNLLTKWLGILCLCSLFSVPRLGAAQRVQSYSQAFSQAGSDGIIIFLYGPDWNERSARMHKGFWMSKAVEEAVGNASLLAVPIYQTPTESQASEAYAISDGMPSLPSPRVCPSILMIDKENNIYANLKGFDDLGDEEGELALKNIRANLDALRRQQSLLNQADSASGEERARLLHEVGELPILPPKDLQERILEADPEDKNGYVRRLAYKPLKFLYEQLETHSGFVSSNYVPDYKKISAECIKIINDQALRTVDRQMAYCLLIGLTRRQMITGRRLKEMIDSCTKIDPNSYYGRLSPTLARIWPALRFDRTAEDRKKNRIKQRERRKKDVEDKKRAHNIEIN